MSLASGVCRNVINGLHLRWRKFDVGCKNCGHDRWIFDAGWRGRIWQSDRICRSQCPAVSLKRSVNYSDDFHVDPEGELVRSQLWLTTKPAHLNSGGTAPFVVLLELTRLETTCTQVCSWLLIICVFAYPWLCSRKRITQQASRHSEKITRKRER